MASNVVIDKKSEADVCKWLEIYIHGDKRVTVHNVGFNSSGGCDYENTSLDNRRVRFVDCRRRPITPG